VPTVLSRDGLIRAGLIRAAALLTLLGATAACDPEIECHATIVGGGQSHTASSKSRDKADDVEWRAIKAACKKRCQDNRVSDADKESVGSCRAGCLAKVEQDQLTVNVVCVGEPDAGSD